MGPSAAKPRPIHELSIFDTECTEIEPEDTETSDASFSWLPSVQIRRFENAHRETAF
jgi:hypothetical protein